MPVFPNHFMGTPAPLQIGEQSGLSSQFLTGTASPAHHNNGTLESVFWIPPDHKSDQKSVFSSQFPAAATLEFSSQIPAAAELAHDNDLDYALPGELMGFPSQFPGAPTISDDGSGLTSQFSGTPATAYNGDLKAGFSSQFIGDPTTAQNDYPIPAFSSQLSGTAAPVYDDVPASIFLPQHTWVTTPLNNGDPMFVSQLTRESELADGGHPISVYPSQLTGAARGYLMPMYSNQPTEPRTPAHGGYSTSVLRNQFSRAAAPMNGGNPISAFSSQHMGLADGYPMPMFTNQLMGTTPAPTPAHGGYPMLWWQRQQASAPAHGGDWMSMVSSQLNGAPALKPWERSGLLVEQVLSAYQNDGTQNQWGAVAAKFPSGITVENEQRHNTQYMDTGKILDRKAESRCWNDGIVVDISREQNYAGDGSFKVVPNNVSFLPPTNLLQGQLPPQVVPLQTPSKKRKKGGKPWTEDEHKRFLEGFQNCERGDWKRISREYVKTKTSTQVASHAQKYLIRQKDKQEGRTTGRRRSIHDTTLD